MPRPRIAWCPPRRTAAPAPVEALLVHAYTLGVPLVEVPLGSLASQAPEVLRLLRRRLEQHQLSASGVRVEAALGSPDTEAAEAATHAALAALEAARLLGAPGITLAIGPEPEDVSAAEVLERAAGELTRVADAARRKGLTLALENRWGDPVHRAEVPMPGADYLQLLTALGPAGVAAHPSTRAALLAGEDPAALLANLPAVPWQVRLGDLAQGKRSRVALGQGLLDLDAVLRQLAGVGFSGVVGLEDDGRAGPETAWQSLGCLRTGIARRWNW
jgi:sugar phosphate isomerase/epimerase